MIVQPIDCPWKSNGSRHTLKVRRQFRVTVIDQYPSDPRPAHASRGWYGNNVGVFTNPRCLIGPDIQRSADTSEIIDHYE